jgi:hypothetical protein
MRSLRIPSECDPDVDDLVVALAVGDQTFLVLVLDFLTCLSAIEKFLLLEG